MKIKVMTDSTSSIPLELAKKKNIAVLEITVEVDGGHKKELTEINRDEFTERFPTLEPVPTTSYASPNDALEKLNKAIEEGYEKIFYPYMTTQISNQVNSVKIASRMVKDKIEVNFYPTQYAGASQAPFVLYAKRMLEEGKELEEISTFLDSVKEHIYTIGMGNDFSTLFKTGKIKKSLHMKVITNTLSLKPLLEVPLDKGVVGFGGGIGFKGALTEIGKRIQAKTDENIAYDLIVTHANAEDRAEKVEEVIRKVRKIHNVIYWKIPPAIVCSVGKGAVIVNLHPNYDLFKKNKK
ncbi:MAG: DegV family protein [Candidatus Heimdallarchaeaceae archaeon]